MEKSKKLSHLFLIFLKFGFFTFGGGWSIVEQMRKEFVEKEKSITDQDLLDMTSIGRSLPGTMIGNAASLYGYRMHGVLGAIISVFSLTIGPLVFLSIITHFYTVFQENMYVLSILKGIRAAVCPIMISAIIGLLNNAFKYPPCILVSILTFALYLFFNVNCVYLILIGIVLGIVISEYYERKGKKNA